MRVLVAIFLLGTSLGVLAEGWGAFSGSNLTGQIITLSPDHNEPSIGEQSVEDIHSDVYVGNNENKYKANLKDVCHRYTNTKQDHPEIWCDGNKKSPLFQVKYQWVKTIWEPFSADDEMRGYKQIWVCVAGCGPHAPSQMLYEP